MFDDWTEPVVSLNRPQNVIVLKEREGGRAAIRRVLAEVVQDHLVGLDVLERMDFRVSATMLKSTAPTDLKSQSGDLGEILATEYVNEKTSFVVPVKRLRFKGDTNFAMRGDDIIGIRRHHDRAQVLKGEAKSRQRFTPSVMTEALTALDGNSSRPNPSTLAMLIQILHRSDRTEEASILADILTNPVRTEDLQHLVFTVCGNDPSEILCTHATSDISRLLVGITVSDHSAFVADAFAMALNVP